MSTIETESIFDGVQDFIFLQPSHLVQLADRVRIIYNILDHTFLGIRKSLIIIDFYNSVSSFISLTIKRQSHGVFEVPTYNASGVCKYGGDVTQAIFTVFIDVIRIFFTWRLRPLRTRIGKMRRIVEHPWTPYLIAIIVDFYFLDL